MSSLHVKARSYYYLVCEGVNDHRIKYGLLTKCEVKMAGYWPSSF